MSALIPGYIHDLKPNENYVVPDLREPYLPRSESLEFFSWVNGVLNKQPSATPKFHYMAMDFALSYKKRVQIEIFRGGAKTVLFTKFLPLYTAAVGFPDGLGGKKKVTFIAVFSATFSQAKALLKDMRNEWEQSKILNESLKIARNTDGKVIVDNESEIAFQSEDGHITHILAMSSNQNMRGLKRRGVRLQLVIFDDILEDDILTSETKRKRLAQWFSSSVVPAIDKGWSKFVVVGTPMTLTDLLHKLLLSKAYHSLKIPISQGFVNFKRDKYGDRHEYTPSVSELYPAWKEWHKPEEIIADLEESRELGTEQDFMREKMLQIVDSTNSLYDIERVGTYSSLLLKYDKKISYYTSLTVSLPSKKGGKRTCLMTIGVKQNGDVIVSDISYERESAHMTSLKLIKVFRKRNYENARMDKDISKKMIMEEVNNFRTKCFMNNLSTNTVSDIDIRRDKLAKIINRGKLFISDGIKDKYVIELKLEIEGMLRSGPTTDETGGLDTLANFTDGGFVHYPEEDKRDKAEKFYDALDPLGENKKETHNEIDDIYQSTGRCEYF